MDAALPAISAVLPEDDPIRLTADGKIIDFLDPAKARPNRPEERVRQTFARKLHYDYGYSKDVMLFEAPIHIGSSACSLDIAVYRSADEAKLRRQSGIALIVETKAPTVKEGEAQLTSYIFATSADGGMWVNDNDAPRYFRRQEVPERKLLFWPNIPRAGLEWDSVGKHTKAKLRPPHNLVETFRRCHNALYRVGIDSADLAMDMVRMILAKYQDELNEGETCEFRCMALEAQSDAGRKAVAERVRSLFRQVRDSDPDVFDTHEDIEAGDREVVTVVSELQDFRFVPEDDSDQAFDVVGAAYEVYVGAHLKGDRGQYFTPRLIVQLLVRMANPGEKDIIFDPAMGSGGFLIAGMRHVIRGIRKSERSKTAKNNAIRAARSRLFGIDKSPKLVKIAKTNMILASDGHAGLVHGDTLEPPERLPPEFVKRAGPGRPTMILTNPPFGATSDHRITFERHAEILTQFMIGRVWGGDAAGRLNPTTAWEPKGVPPEYLFLERCLRWLAPGGCLGIVIPRGILSNGEAKALRTLILRETQLLAVMNCHDDSFKPHTNAKASMILCQRKAHPSDDDDDYPIFMAVSQAIGHTPLGEPIYNEDEKGNIILENGHPTIRHDLDDIYKAWVALRRGEPSPSGNYFMTSRKKLAADLSFNPTLYLPRLMKARTDALAAGERDGWRSVRLGAIAKVFNGPRFKRPYAESGVTSGPNIVRYLTGNAITQTLGENVKYLDLAKAKPTQLRMIDKLYLKRNMLLITDSGTVGRVVYATTRLDGVVGTNNLIRVVVEDDALRGYVYLFLQSPMGQAQLRRSIYGAIVEHIEPPHVADIMIPIPENKEIIKAVGLPVVRGIEAQEEAHSQFTTADSRLRELLTTGRMESGRAERFLALMAKLDAEPASDEEASMMDQVLSRIRGRNRLSIGEEVE